MKYIIFLFLLSVLENRCEVISYEPYDRLQGPKEAQVEWFPYEAVIGPVFCAGILISEKYVISPAGCVYGSSNVTVYFGFRGTPEMKSNRNEKITQIYESSQIEIHENYDLIRNINDIALVKLSVSALLTEKVSPAKLLSSNGMYPFDSTFANVSGWFFRSNNRNLHFETARILSQDICNSYYGSIRIESQELCVEFASSRTSLDLLGNALEVNNKIVGFRTFRRSCLIDLLSCERTGLFLNLIPFLGWISEKTNIPIENLTSETKLEDSSKVLKKTDDQFELIQKSQIKQEQEKANCNEQMKSLLEEFEKSKEKMLERITNLKEDEEIRINDLKRKIDNIQETVDSILQENNVTKLNFEKQLEQVLKVSEEINIRVKRIQESMENDY